MSLRMGFQMQKATGMIAITTLIFYCKLILFCRHALKYQTIFGSRIAIFLLSFISRKLLKFVFLVHLKYAHPCYSTALIRSPSHTHTSRRRRRRRPVDDCARHLSIPNRGAAGRGCVSQPGFVSQMKRVWSSGMFFQMIIAYSHLTA
jgi:hypothetical protein